MLGAIAGDVIGSVYEAHPIKTTTFPLFQRCSRFTDAKAPFIRNILTLAWAREAQLAEGGAYHQHAKTPSGHKGS